MDGKVDRITYKDAGVDVNKADKLVTKPKKKIKKKQ